MTLPKHVFLACLSQNVKCVRVCVCVCARKQQKHERLDVRYALRRVWQMPRRSATHVNVAVFAALSCDRKVHGAARGTRYQMLAAAPGPWLGGTTCLTLLV